MSAKRGSMKYGRAVDGSVAYDLNAPDIYPGYEYGSPLDIPAAPTADEEVVAARNTATSQAISPIAIIGYAIAAVLIVVSLLSRVQLTTLSDDCVALENSLTELQEQQTKLLIAYESTLNLPEIESYAINNLGMQKPRSEQIYYISGDAQDAAFIFGVAEEEAGFADRIGDFISSFMEYFR